MSAIVEKAELKPDGGTHVTPPCAAFAANVAVLAEHICAACPDASALQPAAGATLA
jgi:hypothetical protein